MGYLCANFSLPIGLTVLDIGPMYTTRQSDVRRAASLNASALWGRGHNNKLINKISDLADSDFIIRMIYNDMY